MEMTRPENLDLLTYFFRKSRSMLSEAEFKPPKPPLLVFTGNDCSRDRTGFDALGLRRLLGASPNLRSRCEATSA